MQRLTTVVLLILMALLSACGTSQEKKDQALSQFILGRSELQAGSPQKAFIKFHEALALDPNNKEIHFFLGTTKVELGDYRKAVESLQKAVSIDSEYSEAWSYLCFVYYKFLNEYDKAEQACKKALQNDLYATPEIPMYNLGRIKFKQKQYKDALSYTDKAIKRFPQLIGGYYSKALILNAMGKYGEAEEAMDTAIGLDPRFQGDRKKAEKHFRDNMKIYDPGEAVQYIDILHY